MADPLGGAYAVEAMTDGLEAEAREIFAQIEARGGTLRAVASGWVQQQIQQSAYAWQRRVDAEEAIVVGVNRFQDAQQAEVPLQKIDAEIERRQVERLRAYRLRRSQAPWRAALQGLKDAAQSSGNLMAAIVAAVEAEATVGEIADTLRGVFGEYCEAV